MMPEILRTRIKDSQLLVKGLKKNKNKNLQILIYFDTRKKQEDGLRGEYATKQVERNVVYRIYIVG